MKIRQYSYFSISGPDLSVEDMERILGIPSDGRRRLRDAAVAPDRNAGDAWTLMCDARGLTISDQITRLVERLSPARSVIASLARDRSTTVLLQIVRYLDDEAGEEENLAPGPWGLEKLPGQHQLLGWHVDAEVIQFLAEIEADLDVDEYG